MAKRATKDYRVMDDHGYLDVGTSYPTMEKAMKDCEDAYEDDTYNDGTEVTILEIVKRGVVTARNSFVEWK